MSSLRSRPEWKGITMESVAKQGKPDHGGKKLHVRIENEDDGEDYKFEASEETSLREIINLFYSEKLRRDPVGDDRLRCEGSGEDVLPFADLSFERYLAEDHCPKLRWAFAGGTGGA